MPDILPTIDNEPAQGIQALLDTVYLWNQDVANDLIDKINELIKELDDIVTSGEIKPYSELLAPVRQYIPMFYGNGIYVAAEEIETLPAEPDLSKWILIATKASTLVAGDGIDIENDVVSVEQSVLQGAAAGATAVQPGDLAQVATTGNYNDLNNKPSLGTAAAANVSDFATAAQGVKADTAVQPSDLATVATTGEYADLNGKPNLATVATSGSYNDLDDKPTIPAAQVNSDWNANSGVAQILNKPTLGTAAAADTTDFATAAQGTKADTAAQPRDVSSAISTHNVAADAHSNIISPIATSVSGIEEKIPAQASSSNQLADKEFVNSSIATNTANFIGTFNSVAELEAYSGPVTNNDYAYVIRTDATGNTLYDRYKYTDATTPASWEYEYTLNNSSFTADQWAAINSHATAESIGQISTNQQDISGIQTTIGSFGDIVTHDTNEFATASQGAKADTAVQPADLATVATSGSYNDLSDKPALGTMASETAADYYTKTAADAAFATATQGAKADTAVQPGDLATVATTGDYEDLTNKPVIPGPSVPQYETMPTASASNLGEIAQYSGVTIPDVEESAVATQTVGSGLSDLSVNVDTFIGVEQPSGAETVSFVASVIEDNLDLVGQDGWVITVDSSAIINRIKQDYPAFDFNDFVEGWINYQESTGDAIMGFRDSNTSYQISLAGITFSIVVRGSGSAEDYVNVATVVSITVGSTTWSKNGTTVDLASYGVSYSGTPVDGDTISVAYTPFVAGITNGYFYKSSAEYSNPTATISQTTGSGLNELSVNVETFIEAEQPTQDEQVEFVSAGSVRTMSQTSGTSGDISLSITNIEDFLTEIGSLDDVYIGAGSVITTIYATGNGDDRPYQISIEYTANGTTYARWDLPADQYSVVVSGTSPAGTLMRPIENATVSSEDSWTKDNELVDIAAYGVSYSGLPTAGDVLTVVYAAPTPIGYYWNQTDVQPSSGGGNAGIEWKTKVDLPAEYTGSEWSAAAYFTIVGGLPDGEYELYYSVKCTISSGYPVCERIYKIRIVLNNQGNTVFGQVGYVFDGSYMNNDNRANCLDTRTLYNCMKKNGSDAIFYPSDWFGTDILAYNNHQAVAECFKLSAIKSVETGQEYVAIGEINLDGSGPQYTGEFYGEVQLVRLGQQPYIPEKTGYYSTPIYEFENNTVLMALNTEYCTFTMEHPDSGSVFAVEYTGVRRGNRFVPYTQKISKSTGVFAGCYLAISNDYVCVVGVDTTTAATMSGNVNVALGVLTNNGASIWFQAIPQSATPIGQTGPQGGHLGAITYDSLGSIVQYTGETNANYTNGYFYKATGTVVVIPSSISFTDFSPSDFVVTVSDPDALITAMNNVGGWGEQWVKDRLMYEWSSFQVGYNFDTGTITRVWWNNYGDFYAQDVLDCFAVSTTGSYTGEVIVSFVCQQGYVPESKDVQNPAWIRVDIQPSGGGGGSVPTLTWYTVSSAGTTITIADTSSANLVKVYKNGLLLQPTDDYTISGTTLTTVGALVVGDKITTEVF